MLITNDKVFGYVWFKRYFEWKYLLLYWKNKISEKVKSQISIIRRLMFISGLMTENRGLHWNRYCKLRRN